jgi:hypothetical protein
MFSFFSSIYNSFFNSVNNIAPNLWLGDADSGINLNFLKTHKIDIIVNCTPYMPFITEKISKNELNSILPITFIRIPVYDSLLERDFILMEQYLQIITPFLYKQYTNGKRILIHCHAGKQRSAIVMASLLYILYSNSNKLHIDKTPKHLSNHIFNHIISKRYQAFTFGLRINFLPSFNRYHHII